ncbi:MAG: FAD-dependent oxidoreductase [Alphaproteobacteria bacterium]|nr:FAD-dependent oxidoreductase [Alphaproteobacteria bacterium]
MPFEDPAKTGPLNIAIVGTGIAGLAAAWLLDPRHRVTLYERNAWIGGHANTVDVPATGGLTAVDTGFIVYNERNYPNLTALFAHLDVPTKPSDMSFAASLADGALEYAGTGVNGLLGQRTNAMRPRFWRMVRDLMRFYREAPAAAARLSDEVTIGDFLRDGRYGEAFAEDHLLPMGAAIWSTTAEDIKAYPASAFIGFFAQHGLLTLRNRPRWRTVDGGSREYIDRLAAPFRHRIRFAEARRIHRTGNRVLVEDQQGAVDAYDHVIVAAHADEALRLLADPAPREKRLLGAWRYTSNRAVLHRDPSLMPKRRRVWSSWNFIGAPRGDRTGRVCVTYWMNRLQSLDRTEPLFVTLNPVREPAPGTVIREFDYTHPYFDHAAIASQSDLASLQGRRRTWYCGSYFGYGFHEDALASGLAVAERLGGVRRPWTVAAESGSMPPHLEARTAA